MKIYKSTEYIEKPTVGDLKLKVNSMWDFKARSVCFENIQKSFGDEIELIAYDLEECTDVLDIKTHYTKWKQAEITPEIIEQLKEKGYSISNKFNSPL